MNLPVAALLFAAVVPVRASAAPKPALTPETAIHVAGGPESLEIDDP